jgi:hypothetical protein
MTSITDALGSKAPLGAVLADAVRTLSLNQQIAFSLYRKYTFPLDGLVYWIRVPSSPNPVQAPGIQPTPGLASATLEPGEAIQVAAGGVAASYTGGTIFNPLSAADQGLSAAEPLFVDLTGPAYASAKASTIALDPGASIELPAALTRGAWVNAASGGHKFTVVLLQSVASVDLATDIEVTGSFHYDSAIDQREDAVVDTNTVVFTALQEVQAFNQIGPDYMYIASHAGLRFAFSSRGRYYEPADLFHYLGQALFSVNATQIIEDASAFNPTLVISNSLPIWLAMPGYVPPYPGFTCPIPLFPSYLVTDNLPPPFGSVHIEDTQALGTSPVFGPTLQSRHLSRDRVRVTIYGADNETISTFLAFVEQYSYDWMTLGMANAPVIQDEKHPQPELLILGQRKRIDFDVNYLQSTSRDIARQLIEGAKVQFTPAWLKN